MGFGCHLYVRGVVPNAERYQHIATNSVHYGVFRVNTKPLVPFHSIMFSTPVAALRVECLCKSFCAGKFRTLNTVCLLNAVCEHYAADKYTHSG